MVDHMCKRSAFLSIFFAILRLSATIDNEGRTRSWNGSCLAWITLRPGASVLNQHRYSLIILERRSDLTTLGVSTLLMPCLSLSSA